LPSCVLFFARLGNTSETGQNNNKSIRELVGYCSVFERS
jgi:hypothetical protein